MKDSPVTHTPKHDINTRLYAAYQRELENTIATNSQHLQGQHHSATTMTQNTTTTQDAQNMRPALSDQTTLSIEKFNAVNGIGIGDYLRNIEAAVQAQGFTGARFEKECVALARNRLDLTKSVDLSEVAKSIDLQPQVDKTWEWVKHSFTQSFGHDTSCPSAAFNALFSLKPRDLSIRGIATCISNINAHIQQWQQTGKPAQMVALINHGDCKQDIKKFLTVSILASIFPVDQRPIVCRKLEATDMDQMANRVHELLELHSANNTTTMAAQVTPSTPKNQPNPQVQYSSPQHKVFSNRGRGMSRGNNRGRGFGYQQPQRNTYGYTNQQQQQSNNRKPSPEMAKYWPSNNQCLNCTKFDHRVETCGNPPYCPFHNTHGGHSINQCIAFRQFRGDSFFMEVDHCVTDPIHYAGQ